MSVKRRRYKKIMCSRSLSLISLSSSSFSLFLPKLYLRVVMNESGICETVTIFAKIPPPKTSSTSLHFWPLSNLLMYIQEECPFPSPVLLLLQRHIYFFKSVEIGERSSLFFESFQTFSWTSFPFFHPPSSIF